MKLCRVCLEEEDSILHRMYECPPVKYMADVVTHALQAHYDITITKNTKKHSLSNHHRLFLFLDTPLSLRKNSNKETMRTQKTIAAIANSVTATARKLWLSETRKPTLLQVNNMLQVSLRQIDICYTSYAEQDEIRQISQQIYGIMKRNAVERLQIQYSTPIESGQNRNTKHTNTHPYL